MVKKSFVEEVTIKEHFGSQQTLILMNNNCKDLLAKKFELNPFIWPLANTPTPDPAV